MKMKRFLHVVGLTLGFTLALNAQLAEVDETFNPDGYGAYGGAVPPAIPGQNATDAVVYTAAVYPPSSPHMDKIVIGGRFSSYNGVRMHKLGRLMPDGTVDETFDAGNIFNEASGSHYLYASSVMNDGGVIVAGSFGSVTPSKYYHVLKLNSDGSVDYNFMNPLGTTNTYNKGFNALVHAVHVHGNDLYLGGNFSQHYRGNNTTVNVHKLAKFDMNGVHDPTFVVPANTFPAEVRAIAVQEDGKVLVGYQANRGLVRLNPDGSVDTAFLANIGTGGVTPSNVGIGVYDIKYLHNYVNPEQSKILVSGSFIYWDGVLRGGIVRLNLDGTVDPTWMGNGGFGPSGTRNVFSCTVQPDGKILVAGGAFTQYQGITVPRSIVRLFENGELDTDFLSGTGFYSGTSVYGVAGALRHINLQSDGKLICSGDFTEYNGTPNRMIIRIKTRECSLPSVYNQALGWRNGDLPGMDRYVAIQTGTLTVPTGTHYEACELAVEPGAKIIIERGASFTVNKIIMNNGEIIVEEGGALVQIEDRRNSDTWAGTLRFKRNTTPVRRYDYTYWSAPTTGQTLKNFSPNTLADKYYSFDGQTQQWNLLLNGAEEMQPGVGYIVRAPQTHSVTAPSIFSGEFRGRANSGTYTVKVFSPSSSQFNLIGNPYPSAVDATQFIMDPDNIGKTTGNLYFWTHSTQIVPGVNGAFEYSGSDYMVYNILGATASGASAPAFDGYISSGQGFMVEATTEGDLTFRNEMRVRTHNTQFYRQAAPEYATESNVTINRSRYWIDLTSADGGFNQALVGYVEGATAGMDYGYDGKTISSNSLRVFTLVDNHQLAIQGRGLPFDQNDIVQLGVEVPATGQYTLRISKEDGIFGSTQGVWLRDKLTMQVWNLTREAYVFNSTAGEVLDRFELWYKPKREVTYPTRSIIGLQVSLGQGLRLMNEDVKMKQVLVYDMTGRLLTTVESNEGLNDVIFTELAPKQQVLLLNVQYIDGTTEAKKIVY